MGKMDQVAKVVIEEFANGATVTELAKKYKVSRDTIYNIFRKDGIDKYLNETDRESYITRVENMKEVIVTLKSVRLLLEDSHRELRQRNLQYHFMLKHLTECEVVLKDFEKNHRRLTIEELKRGK